MSESVNGQYAGIYVRLSSDREGRELGVRRQEDDCRARADREGLMVVKVYSDNDLSATSRSRKPRPAYVAMLADAKAGRIGAVIAYSSSRLTRRPRDWEDWIDLAGCRVILVRSGDVDLTTAKGKHDARADAARDAWYADEISELAKRERQQRREQGRYHGGHRPFGFEADGKTPRPAEQRLIRTACREILETGKPLASIAKDWDARGVPPVQRAVAWRASAVREILLNPRVAGLMPDERPSVDWAPVVDEATWRGVKALVTDPARRTGTGPARMLTGLGVCGLCGHKLHGGARSGVAGGYRCSGPVKHLDRHGAPVDEWVGQLVIAYLARERPTLPTVTEDTTDLAQQASGLRARLTEVAALFAAGDVTAAQLKRATATMRAELDKVEARMTAAAGSSALGRVPLGEDEIRDMWDRLDADRRREVIKALGLKVTVWPPGRGRKPFNPETVRVERVDGKQVPGAPGI